MSDTNKDNEKINDINDNNKLSNHLSIENENENENIEPWAMLVPSNSNLKHISLIEKEFSIGRSNRCDYRIDHSHISGTHLKISLIEVDGLTVVAIVDYSSNGTFVNHIRLEKGKRYYLRHMQIISLVYPKSKKWSFSFVDLSFSSNNHEELSNDYIFGDEIGHGTFSIVKCITRREDGEKFAVKIIDKAKFYHIDKTREQIQREVSILKQIQHPYIISIHNVVETDRYLYIILEMATGGDLFHSLELRKKYTENDARRIFRQILEALKYLHNEKHTAHRDLKPENILLANTDENSPIKLTDFGLAKMIDNYSNRMSTMCGTPEYVAPEILFRTKKFNKDEGYGLAVDMWSAGVVLYILLSGCLAFQQRNKLLLYQSIRKGNFSFKPEENWIDVSDNAKDLIRKLIEVNPDIRLTVNQALDHPWFKKPNPKPTVLSIQPFLHETLSQSSLKYNVLDCDDIEIDVLDPSPNDVIKTPNFLIESPENIELSNINDIPETLLTKRSPLPDLESPIHKHPKL